MSIKNGKIARNKSGVNSFDLLLPPYPMGDDMDDNGFNGCRHNCYYCPDQKEWVRCYTGVI